MAQNVKFEQIVKIVNEFSCLGESKGLGKLYTEDHYLNGRTFVLKGKEMLNMGSCSYLGLELDPRLREAAIEAVKKYGTYFSCSRIYVSCGNYLELEELLAKIFDAHILLTTNSTLGHHCIMPIIISSSDMVIYDQQAHISMHELSYKLSHYGTGVTILRHNRLDELEQKIEMYKSKYEKIWYVIDGVYSMFGDLAPIKDIVALLDKHKKLYLYVDDAHGMSWAGPNGSGYTLSQTIQHPKMILGTSMAKGFGSCGGIFAFKNKEWRDKVRAWGGPLAYSGPQEPATVAAAIASAKIHLSNEIYDLQNQLQQKISYCNEIFDKYKIPLVSESKSAIFFVACGLPRVGFELVERMMAEGFYTNIGIFPAVPETCTGVRFTLTNHITFEDIERLAKAFSYHHPRALKSHDRSMKDIYKAFRKFTDFQSRFGPPEHLIQDVSDKKTDASLKLMQYDTIKNIDKKTWNTLLGDRGAFDYDNLLLLENAFTGNTEPENNWKFFYYLVYQGQKVILATFFTETLVKDDMLATEKISLKIEKERERNPYYLTSKSLMMGTLITNGNHLYIDKNDTSWRDALIMMLDNIWKIQEDLNANSLYMRDFDFDDKALNDFFLDQGFVKIDNYDNNVIYNLHKTTFDDYFLKRLNSKKRYQIKNEALRDITEYTFKVNNSDTYSYDYLYQLYTNVKLNNLALNTFELPKKFFELVCNSNNWEVLTLHHNKSNRIAAMSLCLKSQNNYSHVIYGFEKHFEASGVYKKMLYYVLKRAFDLSAKNIFMGITADSTKRKFGAAQIKQVAYIQVKDKYNQELIDSMAFEK